MKQFKGLWSFAPMWEYTTHIVEANNEDEAVEKLVKWAFEHRNCVDEPWDFEVVELATLVDRLQTFMYCTYDTPANYIDDEWLKDKSNIAKMIALVHSSIEDATQHLLDDATDEMDKFGTKCNIELDTNLLKELNALA